MGLIIGTKSGGGSVSIEKLKELLETLPDGQAVSAQVALNTLQLQGFQGLSLSTYDNGDFAIADENGNVLVRCADGHIQTKNFNSADFASWDKQHQYFGEKIALKKNAFDVERIARITRQDTTKNTQGFEVFGNYMFVLQSTGICNVIKRSTNTVVSKFNLGSYDASTANLNHANTCNFGKDIASGSSFPYLYISPGAVGAQNEWKCFVEKINGSEQGGFSSSLVQTITLDISGFSAKGYKSYWSVPCWLVDKERGYLWTFGAIKRTTYAETGEDLASNMYIAHKFAIPSVSSANATLTADDVLQESVFPFDVYATQGGTMYNGKIYYSFGFGGTSATRTDKSYPQMRVYDVDKNAIVSAVNLDGIVTLEPEDIAIADNTLFLSTAGDEISIYKFTF